MCVLGLVIRVVLRLFDISIKMKLIKLWKGLMVNYINIFSFCVLGDEFRFMKRLCLFVSGREVDGREITVQFAKYGPNAEKM